MNIFLNINNSPSFVVTRREENYTCFQFIAFFVCVRSTDIGSGRNSDRSIGIVLALKKWYRCIFNIHIGIYFSWIQSTEAAPNHDFYGLLHPWRKSVPNSVEMTFICAPRRCVVKRDLWILLTLIWIQLDVKLNFLWARFAELLNSELGGGGGEG